MTDGAEALDDPRLLPRATTESIDLVRQNAPPELRALPNWVGGSREPREMHDGTVKSSKVPLDPHTGRNAKSDNPTTWGTFDQGAEFAQRDNRCFGVGINLLGTNLVGLDLDNVLDPETGELLPAARDLLESLPRSYCEISPSGTGLRLFFLGRLPAAFQGSNAANAFGEGTQLECYDGTRGGRYLTVTGRVFEGRSELAKATEEQLVPLVEVQQFVRERGRQNVNGKLQRAGLVKATSGQEPPAAEHARDPRHNDDPAHDLDRAQWFVLARLFDGKLDTYQPWLRLGAACKAFGDEGLQLWIEASRSSPFFDEQEIRGKWPGLTGSSKNTFFALCDEADPTWRERYRDDTQHRGPSGGSPNQAKASTTSTPEERPWPAPMVEAAFRGLAGDFVRLVENETEADRHALLVQMLVFFGNCVGRSPHIMIGATRHGVNLYATITGQTSRGRKGTSEAECRRTMRLADEGWVKNNISSGLSSGEGLIDAIRDAREGPPDKNGKTITIPGIVDKRCMVSEGEFARVLAQVSREGNVLSSILRMAWDGDDLRTMVRGNPARATAPHVSLIAHITQFELLARMSETDLFNGLGNRFLWCCSRRTKHLPFGGNVNPKDIERLADRLRGALQQARKTTRLDFTDDARDYWNKAYAEISVDRPGLWGALTARAEAQVLRLAMLYALLDSEFNIDARHIESARAVWNYCDASVAYLFGNKLGNPTADKLLAAIKAAGAAGLSRTKLSAALGRNTPAGEIDAALQLLLSAGMVVRATVGEGKQATEVWRAKS